MKTGTPSLVLMAALALPSTTLAQAEIKNPARGGPPPQTTEVTSPRARGRVTGRIYIGEQAPDFALWGSRDRETRLSTLRGDWVLLSFADRREGLGPLKEVDAELRQLGVRLLGISHEKAQTLRTYAVRESVGFEMLADVTGEIAALYGLYDSEHRAIVPGFVVLDRQGIVRLALLGQAIPASQVTDLVRFTMTGL